MKKAYTKPMVEKVAFSFDHQVVAASIPPGSHWDTHLTGGCALSIDNVNCMEGQTPNIKSGYDCANYWSLRK